MGIRTSHHEGEPFARGELRLGAEALPTLDGPLRVERAIFYTLGHDRIKLCQPRPLFDLPPLEIGPCDTREEIETLLRRAWAQMQSELEGAREWLEGLGAAHRRMRNGTRLRLEPGIAIDAPCEVRSTHEILLPSTGALAEIDPAAPDARRFRPLAGYESANDLEIGLADAIERCAREHTRDPGLAPAIDAPVVVPQAGRRVRAILIADRSELILPLETALRPRGIDLETIDDPADALAAFRDRSFDVVFTAARLARGDGFEIAHDVRKLPGIEALPVVILDEREHGTHRRIAEEIDAFAYLPGVPPPDVLEALLQEATERLPRRRFRRFDARLAVHAQGAAGRDDLTESIARGGLCLRTTRDLLPGAREAYAIRLPGHPLPVQVVGELVARHTVPGYASILAGIRFLRFVPEDEARWISLIEALSGDAPGQH